MSAPKSKISADFDRRVNKPSVVQRFITEDKTDKTDQNSNQQKSKDHTAKPKSEKASVNTAENEELKDKIDFLTTKLEKINELENKISIIESAQKKLKDDSSVLTDKADNNENNEPKFGEPPVVEQPKSKYFLRNVMEEAVVAEVAASLKHMPDVCKCEKCFNDICAIALNATPPNYATSEQGELLGKANTLLNIQTRNRVSKEVFKAIEKVKKQPMH